METELTNTVRTVGNYNNIPTAITSDALVVTMISGLTITKTADKSIWADGALTYAITINNQSTQSYTSPVITDVLDTSLVVFTPDSVTIDGVKATSSQYTYDESTSTLTVNLEDLAAAATKTITFQVTKKA